MLTRRSMVRLHEEPLAGAPAYLARYLTPGVSAPPAPGSAEARRAVAAAEAALAAQADAASHRLGGMNVRTDGTRRGGRVARVWTGVCKAGHPRAEFMRPAGNGKWGCAKCRADQLAASNARQRAREAAQRQPSTCTVCGVALPKLPRGGRRRYCAAHATADARACRAETGA